MTGKMLRLFWLSWLAGGVLAALEWVFLRCILTMENAHWFLERGTLFFGTIPALLAAALLALAGWKGMRRLTRREAALSAGLMTLYYLLLAAAQQLFQHMRWYSYSAMSFLFTPCRPYSELWMPLRMSGGGFGTVIGCLAIATPFIFLLFAGGKPPARTREETET